MSRALKDDSASRPLVGLGVIDASRMFAGPICGMRLGDPGADVIKLEPPGGEWTRSHGFANAEVGGETTAVLGLNRNKRCLTLNLKDPGGLKLLYRLRENCDVFVQNFRVGSAERLGIGYEQLAADYPELVYCQISGYGEDGPYRDRPGQDLLLQGMSGSMWSVGTKTHPPTAGALWAIDSMTGYQAVIGILAALRDRDSTGRGQKVSVDMWSVAMDCQTQEFPTYLNCGIQLERTDESFAHAWCNPPCGSYRTQDSYILLSQMPIDVVGDAVDDDHLRAITSWSEGENRRDEIRRLLTKSLPLRPRQNGSKPSTSENYGRPRPTPTPTSRPTRFSRSTADVRLPPLLLGEHTTSLLEQAGLSTDEINELRNNGTI